MLAVIALVAFTIWAFMPGGDPDWGPSAQEPLSRRDRWLDRLGWAILLSPTVWLLWYCHNNTH